MRPTFLILALALLGVPAPALARDSSVGFDTQADFTRYRTYAFGDSQAEGNPLVRERILTAVERELEARGLKKVKEEADLQVVFHGSTRRTITSESWGYAPGPGWSSRRGEPGEPRTFKIGTLVVDILEGSTKRLVWRGVAPDVLSDDPMKHEKTINAAAKKMFARFPLERTEEKEKKEQKQRKGKKEETG